MLPTPVSSPTAVNPSYYPYHLDDNEYGPEIMEHMLYMELQCLPIPFAMDKQAHITWSMRKTLILWIIEVHLDFNLVPETLYLAVNLIDRMCSKITILRSQYQLLGIASLWIAAKFEENHGRVPTLKKLSEICCHAYRIKDFITMERLILSTLGFNIGGPTAESFLKAHVALSWSVHPTALLLSRYIMEQTLVHKRFFGLNPSLIAECSLLLAHEYLTGTVCQDPKYHLPIIHLQECMRHVPLQIVRKVIMTNSSMNQSGLSCQGLYTIEYTILITPNTYTGRIIIVRMPENTLFNLIN